MKLSINDIGGEVVKKDYRYTVTDNTHLNNLVVSSTTMKANKSTNGHKHKGQEEVYMFISIKISIKTICLGVINV